MQRLTSAAKTNIVFFIFRNNNLKTASNEEIVCDSYYISTNQNESVDFMATCSVPQTNYLPSIVDYASLLPSLQYLPFASYIMFKETLCTTLVFLPYEPCMPLCYVFFLECKLGSVSATFTCPILSSAGVSGRQSVEQIISSCAVFTSTHGSAAGAGAGAAGVAAGGVAGAGAADVAISRLVVLI